MSKRPNIVVALADDMGFSDIGCYGSEINTPNIDSLGAEGVRFTQFYNCARCCPTRASLLTGLYPHQAGVGHMVSDHGVGPAYQGSLRNDCMTIGEVLREAGYHTCYSGKWHVSPCFPAWNDPEAIDKALSAPLPLKRGFDRFYGTIAGCGNYFNPHGLMDQDKIVYSVPEDFYYTDAISHQACKMIDEAVGLDKPFFLHICHTAPHWPLHARPEDASQYSSLYRKGWDYFRTARHEEMKKHGMVDPKWPISPKDPAAHDFFSKSEQMRIWEADRMAVYAAQIECMDRGVGMIKDKLRSLGALDDTLIMFLSDNGGCAEFLNEDGDGRSWPSMYRHTAPPGHTCVVGNIPLLQPGPASTFMSYDLPWANVSNTPFRKYKSWVHEGGISTPAIVSYPKGIGKGMVVHEPCHVIDIMPTCIELAGASYPCFFRGVEVTPLEGESFLPILEGRSRGSRDIAFEHQGNRALRSGDWKIVSANPGEWELYNINDDRTELNDLASTEKDRLSRMVGQYRQWAERCGVLDWPLKKNKQ